MLGAIAEKFRMRVPAKSQGPVVDLDAIIQESQWVRFHGKVHEIKPIEVGEFFALANGFANIEAMMKKEQVTTDEIVNAYYGIIMPVCPTITKEMIRSSSAAQVAALIQFVKDHIDGRVTDEKKKTLTKMKTA
jgi:hypothetical protein